MGADSQSERALHRVSERRSSSTSDVGTFGPGDTCGNGICWMYEQTIGDLGCRDRRDVGVSAMNTILVAVDGSRPSLAALAWANQIAPAMDSSLLVMAVATPPQIELPPELVEAEVEMLRKQLHEDWCRNLGETGSAYEIVAVCGDAPNLILETSARRDVVMTVIGARGEGGFSGLPIGSVCDYVIHRAERAVAVVPDTPFAHAPVSRLVLGIDPGDPVGAHVRFCARLGSGLRAEVIAVAAHREMAEWVAEGDPRSWHTDMIEKLSTTWTQPLHTAHVRTTYRIEETSHATEALLDVAVNEHADAIVVGTRSVSGWRMLRLGGVTMSLVHHTDRPIIIVPPRS